MGIEIDSQRIMCWYLCKINKHFVQFPIKVGHYHVDCLIHNKLIYHKNLSNFFLRYFNIHLGNTLLVDNTPYRTYLSLPFNAMFVESYGYAPKEDNYLMTTLLPYLEFLHYFGLSVPTFVELYPFTLWGGGAMVKDLTLQCGGEEFKSWHLQPRLLRWPN